jgi:hypothetical protein
VGGISFSTISPDAKEMDSVRALRIKGLQIQYPEVDGIEV